jgi:hypothetical protein
MNIWTKCWRSSIAVAMVAMALLVTTPKAFADNINRGVHPIHARFQGLTYGQWSAIWWQQAFLATPSDDCPLQSRGQMFFLDGFGPPARSCTIPTGKHIMFPIFNAEWSVFEAEGALTASGGITSCFVFGVPIRDINGNLITGTDDSSLRACAVSQARHALGPGTTLEAVVDGRTLVNLAHYEAESPPFDFNVVAGNLGGVPEPSHAVADGFWIILNPLSAGVHTVHFLGTAIFPETSPPTPVTFEETYTLMVK